MDWLNAIPDWVKYLTVAAGAASTAAAWLRWGLPHLRLVVLTFLTARGIAHELGGNAAQIIRQLAADVERDRSLTVLRHDAICHRLGLGVFVAEPEEGRITFANDMLHEMLGTTGNAADGFGWLSSVVGDRTAILAEWKFAVKNGMTFERSLAFRNARTNEIVNLKMQARPALVDRVRLCYVGVIEREGAAVCPWRADGLPECGPSPEAK